MQKIAVGNLYRYFPNKEYLFEAVVSPAYDQLMELIQTNEQDLLESSSFIGQIGHIFAEIVDENREGLLILLDSRPGTPFHGTKEELFDRLMEILAENLDSFNRKHPSTPLNLLISRPLAVAFLEGCFDIIRNHTSRDLIMKVTKDYISIWFMGLNTAF
ncbi:TetR/AcrR family transcriptional regulator [Paenibacillus pinihumi]|uniref:TetR/AcrR family transcriptional regulator n=1 Tax=Paenibacillus pinihumi TaxID=669462 RepID=UPI0004049255|nr:TetR/AcrR family transcriptional regulator [Paenibacillus pinihumi]